MLEPPGWESRIPRWLRPRAALWLGGRVGRLVLHGAGELVRVQIFDRSMTLAAQSFTSIFPLLIMLAAVLGPHYRSRLTGLLHLPADSERLLQEALSGSHSNAFGLAGSVIVILSATGLSRALVRSYLVVWTVEQKPAGAAATGRQIGTVLVLVVFLLFARVLGWLASLLPAPHVSGLLVSFVADCSLAILLPWLLLGGRAPRGPLLAGGVVFGLLMIAVRGGEAIYLPRALKSSTDKYGTIGLTFTYIGWLYVLSFCLLLAAIIGGIVSREFFTRVPADEP
ncbi:YhjD/YihY/BrkB family envelope integrity protein [Actinoplanes oblitus]|uniref:YhjD/YihY/BrkB family envelope integrity protein n=1 Tax=Actinoplanes oblitus TaxID=3040509 RepID=A0ABY8WQ18_9ACTN|nr:YhjD/YihY/BrkB family envelope integrity protein [Actinoplanes oblitus]WIM98414.1 YhjD/YihY/BrkB family envelope integrity protein [Actinoplanes oblitus]